MTASGSNRVTDCFLGAGLCAVSVTPAYFAELSIRPQMLEMDFGDMALPLRFTVFASSFTKLWYADSVRRESGLSAIPPR